MFRSPIQSPKMTRIILWLSCVAVGLGNSYLPLPTPTLKDRSVPFPCQDNACGCRNAAQCWSSCCCNTDAQKLAWANENSVTPPDSFLQKMAAQRSNACCSTVQGTAKVDKFSDVANAANADPSACCCVKSEEEYKAQPRKDGHTHACCQSQTCRGENVESFPVDKTPAVIQAVRRCQGVVGNFFIVSLKLLPVADLTAVSLDRSERVCRCVKQVVLPPRQAFDPMPD